MSMFDGNKESYKDKKSLVIYFSRADENYYCRRTFYGKRNKW